MMRSAFLIFWLLVGFSAAALADNTISLRWPLACTLGKDCWILNYPAIAVANQPMRDFACGQRFFAGHNSTDIAVRDVTAQAQGIAVLAAADGKVLRVRNGEEDSLKTEATIKAAKDNKRACGNGILLQHTNNIKTLYCHLQKDSMLVKAGDSVIAGQPLAKIGLSGHTQHPQLGFTVYRAEQPLDPFGGQSLDQPCQHDASKRQGWWQNKDIAVYQASALYAAGISTQAPTLQQITNDATTPALSAQAPALVIWAGLFGVQSGDAVSMTLFNPNGAVVLQETVVVQNAASRLLLYRGRNKPEAGWMRGTYRGTISLASDRLPKTLQQDFTAEIP